MSLYAKFQHKITIFLDFIADLWKIGNRKNGHFWDIFANLVPSYTNPYLFSKLKTEVLSNQWRFAILTPFLQFLAVKQNFEI